MNTCKIMEESFSFFAKITERHVTQNDPNNTTCKNTQSILLILRKPQLPPVSCSGNIQVYISVATVGIVALLLITV